MIVPAPEVIEEKDKKTLEEVHRYLDVHVPDYIDMVDRLNKYKVAANVVVFLSVPGYIVSVVVLILIDFSLRQSLVLSHLTILFFLLCAAPIESFRWSKLKKHKSTRISIDNSLDFINQNEDMMSTYKYRIDMLHQLEVYKKVSHIDAERFRKEKKLSESPTPLKGSLTMDVCSVDHMGGLTMDVGVASGDLALFEEEEVVFDVPESINDAAVFEDEATQIQVNSKKVKS